MFIVRCAGERLEFPNVQVKLSRSTPSGVAGAAAATDFFCVGDTEAMAALRQAGWTIVELHDGYYEDGRGGGVGIWGQGRYWEIRSEPLTIAEACGPGGESAAERKEGEHVEVRRAIFGV
ncbi:MAG TPA: hypothetical protein VGQ90_06370 [Stellaceae bacterium]|nr:hypothetical protein [Stellaceae bacterium]